MEAIVDDDDDNDVSSRNLIFMQILLHVQSHTGCRDAAATPYVVRLSKTIPPYANADVSRGMMRGKRNGCSRLLRTCFTRIHMCVGAGSEMRSGSLLA